MVNFLFGFLCASMIWIGIMGLAERHADKDYPRCRCGYPDPDDHYPGA